MGLVSDRLRRKFQRLIELKRLASIAGRAVSSDATLTAIAQRANRLLSHRPERIKLINMQRMLRLLVSALMLLAVTSVRASEAAPDAAELTKLLNDFLAGASRNDAAMHERFWADDLIYTSALGVRRGKAEILENVRSGEAPKPEDGTTVYSAEDIRIQQYGDTAIVAFRLVSTTDKAGAEDIANYFNTGTFLKRGGKWQVVGWQATKIPAESEAKK